MSESRRNTSPFEDLVVIDLSTNVTSAYATQLFADHGAEVIQVERSGGSYLRRMASAPFYMRGKKSIELDLKDPADLITAHRLAEGADVVVEAFGAGRADNLGLGYDELARINQRLVYTSITGFGHRGPYAHLKCYEAVVMAKTGSMYGNIVPERPGEPVMTVPLGATMAGAFLALQGTLLALHERQRSGAGQRVDATLMQGMLSQDPWSYFMKRLAEKYPEAFTAVGAPDPNNPVPTSWLTFGLLNGYTKDQRWLQFSHSTPRLFQAFVRALGLESTLAKPEWHDAPNDDDDARRDAWWTLMLEAVREKTADEWLEIFESERHVNGEVYLDGLQLFEHPQMVHDNHVVTAHDPSLGAVRQMGPLVKMSATPGDAARPAPTLNQNGAELRARERRAPSTSRVGPDEDAPALDGITIVDLGTFYAGPFGSTMLADQGATVIKIEPLDGDPIRFQMPIPEASGARVTQGKKSVAVDVFTDEGRMIVSELIRKADLVLHTYRAGVAERMGLDAAAMCNLNPNLVYHHGVGYGVEGPYAASAALAPTIAAGSGFARRCGGGGVEGVDLSLNEVKLATTRIAGAPPGHPDGMAALGVAVGLLLGLYARDRGAGGQVTMTTMLSTMGHVLGDSLIDFDGVPAPPIPDPQYFGYSALYRLYRASDGWIVLCAPQEHEWRALVDALPADAALGEDARFSAAGVRRQHDADLIEALGGLFASRPAAHWEQTLSAAGVGCAEVMPYQGALAMGLFEPGGIAEQLDMVTTVSHPIFDDKLRSRELVRLSRSKPTIGVSCTIGEHTDEILKQYLDYDDARLAELRAANIIGG